MDYQERGLLVVSTDIDILQALSHALTLSGYAVTTARDLAEARGLSVPVYAIVYDIKDLDRSEWGRLVELQRAHPDLSVVLLSSLESRELDRALAEGLIAGYQVKPIHLTPLEECLKRVGAKGQRAGAENR